MLHDLRAAIRAILKDRWLAFAAIFALALGIGVNATVFTLVNAVLIRGLPFPESQNLYVFGTVPLAQQGSGTLNGVSYQEMLEWRSQSQHVAGMAAFSSDAAKSSAGCRLCRWRMVCAARTPIACHS